MSVIISYPSTQFEVLYGPFVNLWVHLPPKDNSPYLIYVLSFSLTLKLIISKKKSIENFPNHRKVFSIKLDRVTPHICSLGSQGSQKNTSKYILRVYLIIFLFKIFLMKVYSLKMF